MSKSFAVNCHGPSSYVRAIVPGTVQEAKLTPYGTFPGFGLPPVGGAGGDVDGPGPGGAGVVPPPPHTPNPA